MPEKSSEGLEKIAGELSGIEGSLRALTERVQTNAGGLTEELAEIILDRLDEMMDLLYLLDDRLARLLDEIGSDYS